MRKFTYTLTILLSTLFVSTFATNIDSLQKQLDTAQDACLKAELYTNIAAELIQFNGPKTREISYADAGKAIDYVLKAIHENAKHDDTLALRNNFDCLGSAYFIQKKYTQAKWFILQSNFISRNRKDVPAIINSLMTLANIKIAIKDYKMAEKDFNEAIVLSKYQNNINRKISIEKCLASMYEHSGNTKNAAIIEKRFNQQIAAQQKNALLQAQAQKAKQQKMLAMLKPKKVKKPLVLAESMPALVVQSDDNNTNNSEAQTATVLAVNGDNK